MKRQMPYSTKDLNYNRTRQNAKINNGIRHKKKKKKKTSLLYRLLIAIIVGLASFLIISTLFKIDTIEVEGETQYDKNKIINLTEISYGQNLFTVNSSNIKNILEKELYYLEKVDIKKKFLGTVIINVQDAKPIIAIYSNGRYILLSKSLKILETDVDIVPSTAAIVSGVELNSPEIGLAASYNVEYKEKFDVLTEIISLSEKLELQGINYINIEDIYNIKMEYESRIAIKFGTQSRLKRKISNIKKIVDESIDKNACYVIDSTLQESDNPRTGVLPVNSLEEYYSGTIISDFGSNKESDNKVESKDSSADTENIDEKQNLSSNSKEKGEGVEEDD